MLIVKNNNITAQVFRTSGFQILIVPVDKNLLYQSVILILPGENILVQIQIVSMCLVMVIQINYKNTKKVI